MSDDYSEDALIEQPAIELFGKLGYETKNCFYEKCGEGSTLGRQTTNEVVLVPRLRKALQELNAKRRQGDVSTLAAEIERVGKTLARLDDQERRLVKLYTLAEIDDSFLKRESAQLKKQRVELEADVVLLEKQKRQTESLDKVSDQVRDYCAKVATKLDNFSFDEKHLALKALQIKVVVGKSGVKLFGLIPDFNATIEQTSA